MAANTEVGIVPESPSGDVGPVAHAASMAVEHLRRVQTLTPAQIMAQPTLQDAVRAVKP